MKVKSREEVRSVEREPVTISAGPAQIDGDLTLPERAKGLIIFAHGSGSSRHSPRNQFVAGTLHELGFGTVLLDLLSPEEEARDEFSGRWRFDIRLLAERLEYATQWAHANEELRDLPKGYFGSSTGAAAALVAAAEEREEVRAVVSRGGRPDLAGEALRHVMAPTLLIVGGHDESVITLNEEAAQWMTCEKDLVIVPGATHLFAEPGALDHVARLAGRWFLEYL